MVMWQLANAENVGIHSDNLLRYTKATKHCRFANLLPLLCDI
jgi:hypothetical protein